MERKPQDHDLVRPALTRKQVRWLINLAQWSYDQADDTDERRSYCEILRRLKAALEVRP